VSNSGHSGRVLSIHTTSPYRLELQKNILRENSPQPSYVLVGESSWSVQRPGSGAVGERPSRRHIDSQPAHRRLQPVVSQHHEIHRIVAWATTQPVRLKRTR